MTWTQAALTAAGIMAAVGVLAVASYGLDRLHDLFPRTVEYVVGSVLVLGVLGLFTLLIKEYS